MTYELYGTVPQLNIHLPYDPAILLLNTYSTEMDICGYKKTCTRISTAGLLIMVPYWKQLNAYQLENESVAVYSYNWIISSNRKEWASDTNNMDEFEKHLAEWKKETIL